MIPRDLSFSYVNKPFCSSAILYIIKKIVLFNRILAAISHVELNSVSYNTLNDIKLALIRLNDRFKWLIN